MLAHLPTLLDAGVANDVVPNCISQVRGAGITIPIAHQATWPGELRDCQMSTPGIDGVLRWISRRLSSDVVHLASAEWCNENYPGQLYPHCTQWQPVAGLVDLIFVTGECDDSALHI
jgi:hypothetical protein